MEKYETFIKVKIVVPGVHSWSKAPIDSFLQCPHRHLFHIIATIKVTHDDRQVEFFESARLLKDFLFSYYESLKLEGFNFGGASCETIAKTILDNYNYINEIEVSEDGENSAIVRRVK